MNISPHIKKPNYLVTQSCYDNIDIPDSTVLCRIYRLAVFAKTSPKRSFSMRENERFGLVIARTGSTNSGTDICDLQKLPRDASFYANIDTKMQYIKIYIPDSTAPEFIDPVLGLFCAKTWSTNSGTDIFDLQKIKDTCKKSPADG